MTDVFLISQSMLFFPMNVVYDIPVLHIEDRLVAKGRWGKSEIEEALRAWNLKECKG